MESLSGKESDSQGLQIRVENPELFLKAIKDGISGEAGSVYMEYPVERVAVDLLSDKDTFNMQVEIEVPFHTITGERRETVMRDFLVFDGYKKVIERNFSDIKERGGVFIVKGKMGTTMAIVKLTTPGGLQVTTGNYQEYSFSEPVQYGTKPNTTPEDLESVIGDLDVTTNLLIREMYRCADKPMPQEKIVLRPPKRKIEDRSFGKTTTPRELLGRLQVEKPDVSFEEIGGLKETKREIQGLAFALKNPELYQKWGTRPPKGILLHGEPGTGKTLVAKALASQAEARFFHVQVSDIASKWYGDSEQIVNEIFNLASGSGENTIIFFDEIDAIAGHRDNAHEATQRVISTLLENMDGMTSKDNVMVVASTNRIDAIDPAILRAGRFDRWVEVPLPDEDGRKQILSIHMNRAQKIADRELFHGLNMEDLIAKTNGLSGADIAELIRRALEEKVRQEGMGGEIGLITTGDILKELAAYEKKRKQKQQMGFIPPEKRV